MSRFSMRSPHLPIPAGVARAFAIAGFLLVAAPCAADVVVIDVPLLVRKFPEGFCQLPVTVPFTPTGSQVTIHFAADVYVLVDQGSGPVPVYTDQSIDNVAVVPTTIHNAHSVDNNGDYANCYLDAPVPKVFLFDDPGVGTVPLLEQFASAAPGWDVSQDCFFDNSRSADNDPSDTVGPHDQTGGSLRLGSIKANPSVPDIARTSRTVTGLTPGLSYTLSGWWHAIGGIFTNQVTLKIRITEPESTPVNGGTWGSLKIRYR